MKSHPLLIYLIVLISLHPLTAFSDCNSDHSTRTAKKSQIQFSFPDLISIVTRPRDWWNGLAVPSYLEKFSFGPSYFPKVRRRTTTFTGSAGTYEVTTRGPLRFEGRKDVYLNETPWSSQYSYRDSKGNWWTYQGSDWVLGMKEPRHGESFLCELNGYTYSWEYIGDFTVGGKKYRRCYKMVARGSSYYAIVAPKVGIIYNYGGPHYVEHITKVQYGPDSNE